MSLTKSLSDKTIEFAFAAGLVSSTIDSLRDFRSDHNWEQTYKYICDVAALNNIEDSIVLDRRQHPRRLQDSITFKSTESLSCSKRMKANAYFPILDCILLELNHHFSNSNYDARNPTSSHFLDSSLLSSLALLYKVNYEHSRMNVCWLVGETVLDKTVSTYADHSCK